jgi:hypothetical protein
MIKTCWTCDKAFTGKEFWCNKCLMKIKTDKDKWIEKAIKKEQQRQNRIAAGIEIEIINK